MRLGFSAKVHAEKAEQARLRAEGAIDEARVAIGREECSLAFMDVVRMIDQTATFSVECFGATTGSAGAQKPSPCMKVADELRIQTRKLVGEYKRVCTAEKYNPHPFLHGGATKLALARRQYAEGKCDQARVTALAAHGQFEIAVARSGHARGGDAERKEIVRNVGAARAVIRDILVDCDRPERPEEPGRLSRDPRKGLLELDGARRRRKRRR